MDTDHKLVAVAERLGCILPATMATFNELLSGIYLKFGTDPIDRLFYEADDKILIDAFTAWNALAVYGHWCGDNGKLYWANRIALPVVMRDDHPGEA